MSSRPDDLVFQHDLDQKYVCPICLAVFWEPVQTTCGHRFCRECINGVHVSRSIGKCPIDKSFLNLAEDIFEDKAFKREVLSLKVRCANQDTGCGWTDELREFQKHFSGCPYSQELCPNGCGRKLLKRFVKIHHQICEQRPVQCEHCAEQIIYADLTKHQVLMCASFPVQCTLCGQTGIRRKDIPSHIDVNTGDCPRTIIPCRYASNGCQYQGERRCMVDHYKGDTDHHIHLLVQHSSSQDRIIRDLTEELTNVKVMIESLSDKWKNI